MLIMYDANRQRGRCCARQVSSLAGGKRWSLTAMSKVRSHHRPNIAIGPRKAASLALALHELATNVAKSGTSGAVYIE